MTVVFYFIVHTQDLNVIGKKFTILKEFLRADRANMLYVKIYRLNVLGVIVCVNWGDA